MTQMSPMEPYDQARDAAADYHRHSRLFLVRAREYLAVDDLHQASEKGWGAAGCSWAVLPDSFPEAQGCAL